VSLLSAIPSCEQGNPNIRYHEGLVTQHPLCLTCCSPIMINMLAFLFFSAVNLLPLTALLARRAERLPAIMFFSGQKALKECSLKSDSAVITFSSISAQYAPFFLVYKYLQSAPNCIYSLFLSSYHSKTHQVRDRWYIISPPT
jgi:hypothetical protein